MNAPIPVLRMFDESKAREFYLGFLGFQVDWEHRFEDGMPLYMQVSRGACVIHLTEHFGDCAPGARIRIGTPHLDAYVDGLRGAFYKHCHPGRPEIQPWGLSEISLADPFGNHLTLFEVPA